MVDSIADKGELKIIEIFILPSFGRFGRFLLPFHLYFWISVTSCGKAFEKFIGVLRLACLIGASFSNQDGLVDVILLFGGYS